MRLSNKAYNAIKWLITIFLPSVGALYWGMVQTWDFPRITGVNGTINSVIALLGLFIAHSSKNYRKRVETPDGELIVNELDGEKHLSLGVIGSIDQMTSKKEVRLSVIIKEPMV